MISAIKHPPKRSDYCGEMASRILMKNIKEKLKIKPLFISKASRRHLEGISKDDRSKRHFPQECS